MSVPFNSGPTNTNGQQEEQPTNEATPQQQQDNEPPFISYNPFNDPRRTPPTMSNIPPDILYEVASHLTRSDRSALRATNTGYESLLAPDIFPRMLFWVYTDPTEQESANRTLENFNSVMNRIETSNAVREMTFSLHLKNPYTTVRDPTTANNVGQTCLNLLPKWNNLQILRLKTQERDEISQLAIFPLIRYLTNENSSPKPTTLILNNTRLIDLTRPRHWIWVSSRGRRVLARDWFPAMRPWLQRSIYCGKGHIWWKTGEELVDNGIGGLTTRDITEGWYYIFWVPEVPVHPGEDLVTLVRPRDDDQDLTLMNALTRRIDDEDDNDDRWDSLD